MNDLCTTLSSKLDCTYFHVHVVICVQLVCNQLHLFDCVPQSVDQQEAKHRKSEHRMHLHVRSTLSVFQVIADALFVFMRLYIIIVSEN